MEDKLAYMNDQHQLEWHESLELIFSELLDESQVRAFFHKKSHEYYSKENIKYQLPIIIFSAVAGSGNFISSTFPDVQQYIILGVGGLSIGTSIISSISQFLKLSQLSEGHRIAYLSWEKFYANIKLQLRRKKDDRDDIKDFMNNITAEYQRLKEISPEIPPHIACLIKKNRRLFNENGIQVPFIFEKFQHISAYGTEQDAARIKRRMSHIKRRSSSGLTGDEDSNSDSYGSGSGSGSSSSKNNTPQPGLWSAFKSFCISKLTGNNSGSNAVNDVVKSKIPPFQPPALIPSHIEELNANVKATNELIFQMQNEIQTLKNLKPTQFPQPPQPPQFPQPSHPIQPFNYMNLMNPNNAIDSTQPFTYILQKPQAPPFKPIPQPHPDPESEPHLDEVVVDTNAKLVLTEEDELLPEINNINVSMNVQESQI